MSKTCPKCQVTKPGSEWSKNRGRADGLAAWCKACTSAYSREYNQRPEVRQRNAARALANYHAMSPEERAAYNGSARRSDWYMRKKYGIGRVEYERMLADQGGGCAMCGKPPPTDRRLAVDHDHACCPAEKTCGKCVRGLLCTTCNVWLGYYENKEWMARADEYLGQYVAREIERVENDG